MLVSCTITISIFPLALVLTAAEVNEHVSRCDANRPLMTAGPCLCSNPQMAKADQRFGQRDGSDQNFDYMFKLLIIGNSSVGKTSFLFRYADDSFSNSFVSTVGIDFKVKTVYRNDKRIKLQIWVSAAAATR